jgi:large subunit ribosomal protein L28
LKITHGGVINMSRVCSVCGKGQTTGNNVSHSKRRTRRTFKANVQKVSYVTEGKIVNDYVCARCLKTVERA